MKTDYLGKVDTGIASFFTEVSKEIIHQVVGTSLNTDEDEKKSVLEDTSQAYGDAVGSAISQQKELDREMTEFDNSIQEDFLTFNETGLNYGDSDDGSDSDSFFN